MKADGMVYDTTSTRSSIYHSINLHILLFLSLIMKVLLAALVFAQVSCYVMGVGASCTEAVGDLTDDVSEEMHVQTTTLSGEHDNIVSLINDLQDSVDWMKRAIKHLVRGKKGYGGHKGFGGHKGYGGYGGYGGGYGGYGKW